MARLDVKPIAFVHPGLPKTGSTSIQHFLRDQEALVTGQGLYIPRTGRKGGEHHALTHALTGRRGSSALATAQLTEELRANGTPDIVISAESIDGVVVGTVRRHVGEGVPPIEMLRVLHECGYHVRFVLYVRNFSQLINSLYQQDTKALRNDAAFVPWCKTRLPRRARGLSLWSRIAGFDDVDLVARPFNTAIKKEGVVRDFCRSIGIVPPDEEPPRANESIGPIYLEASRHIHRRMEDQLDDQRLSRRVWRSLRRVYEKSGVIEERYCGLTSERARAFEASVAAETDTFAQHHLEHSWAASFADDMRENFVLNDVAELNDANAMATARELGREAIRHARKRLTAG